MGGSVVNGLIKGERGDSGFDALTPLAHLTLAAVVLLLTVVMVTHGRRVVGIEAAEQRRLVERVNLSVEQLLHDFGQFVCVVFVVDEQHDGKVSPLSSRTLAEQWMIRLRNVRLHRNQIKSMF